MGSPEISGPVSSVATRWMALQPDGSEKIQHSQVAEYDSDGRVLSLTFYKADGTLWYGSVHRYDVEGRLYEIVHKNSDFSTFSSTFDPRPPNPKHAPRVDRFSAPKGKGDLSYNIDGFENRSFSAPAGQRVTVFYDADGKARDVKILGRFGMPAGRMTFDYDENGRLATEATYGWQPEGYGIEGARSPWRITVARLVAPIMERFLRIYLFLRGVYAHIRRYDFVRARRSLVYGTLMNETFRTYDDAGRTVEERQVFFAGMLDTRTTRSYDDRGFVLEQHMYDREKLTSRERYTREFDEHGNWTNEILVRWPRGCGGGTCNMEGEATFITYRTIEYAKTRDLRIACGNHRPRGPGRGAPQ